ncbi:MAG: hydroxyacid dehydrogenase, partial [Candidatus Paceibacterota bacterium]
LKAVIRGGVGLDNIDQEYCKTKGIAVYNTPGASTNAVAELAIGVMLSLFRNIPRADREMRNEKWIKKELTGFEVSGKTLGIIGFGRIGSLLAKKAIALGMEIIAYDPRASRADGVTFLPLDELYEKADVISLHTVLVPETREMINENSISKMKNGIYILNLARGELINEDALYEGLKSGKIKGAGLDVFSNEPYNGKLLKLENVVLTPHIGAGTKEAQGKIGEEIVEIIKKINDEEYLLML